MAKSESEAALLFREKLKDAITGENIIYVISEKEHINFPITESTIINLTAEQGILPKFVVLSRIE